MLLQTKIPWGGQFSSVIVTWCCTSYEVMCRRDLPHDLARAIEGAKEKGEEVQRVSTGLDGDWFLRTDMRHGMSYPHDLYTRIPIRTTVLP